MTDLFGETCPCCGQAMPKNAKPAASVPGFTAFWMKVPQKIGRAAAEKAWKKLRADEKLLAADRIEVFYAWFRKEYPTASMLHPATYLNAKRWEDVEQKSEAPTATDIEVLRKGAASSIPAVRDAAIKMAAAKGITL